MTFLPLLLLLSGTAQDPEFTQADLQLLVDRVSAVAEKFDKYLYPPTVRLTFNDRINAFSTVEAEGDDLRAVVEFELEMIKAFEYDEGMIMSVLCHEFAHLAKGHSYYRLVDIVTGKIRTDVESRGHSQFAETEADKIGLRYLLQTGGTREDAMKAFRWMENDQRRGRNDGYALLHLLSATHPSAIDRMASIAEDPAVWESLLTFRTGLALMEFGEWTRAIRQFNRAIRQEDGLEEAYVNRAICSLRHYYDLLSNDVRASWPIPEFYYGVWLKWSTITARGGGIDVKDRERYAEAKNYISEGLGKFPTNGKLLGMSVQVLSLHPDQVPKAEFLESRQKLLDLWEAPGVNMSWEDKRVDDTALMSYYDRSELSTTVANTYRAALMDHYMDMMGEVALDLGLTKDESKDKWGFLLRQTPNIASLLSHQNTAPEWKDGTLLLMNWLMLNPATDIWNRTNEQYQRLCAAIDAEPEPVEPAMPTLATTISVQIAEGQVTLMDEESDLVKVLGAPSSAVDIDPGRPGLRRLYWIGANASSVLLVDGKTMAFSTARVGATITVRLGSDRTANARTVTFEVGKTLEHAVASSSGALTMIDLRSNMLGSGLFDEADVLGGHKIYFANGLTIARRPSDGVILSLSISA